MKNKLERKNNAETLVVKGTEETMQNHKFENGNNHME